MGFILVLMVEEQSNKVVIKGLVTNIEKNKKIIIEVDDLDHFYQLYIISNKIKSSSNEEIQNHWKKYTPLKITIEKLKWKIEE